MGHIVIDELSEKYDSFANLLLTFLEHGYRREDGENLKDIDVINEFIKDYDADFTQQCIVQAKEILAMEPFPEDWICRTSGDRLPFDDYREDTPENYRAWVQWMVKALEEEAQKAGKL